ncbi:MAG: hypothetical protein Q4A67_07425 [Aerococcus sp.]|nr:hypothetical protein [Aerococcus sp.]
MKRSIAIACDPVDGHAVIYLAKDYNGDSRQLIGVYDCVETMTHDLWDWYHSRDYVEYVVEMVKKYAG